MQEIYDDDDGGVTIVTNVQEPVPDIPDPQLRYIRPSMDKGLAAEICLKDGDYYVVLGLTRDQLMNILKDGQELLRQFDKRPIENTEIEG